MQGESELLAQELDHEKKESNMNMKNKGNKDMQEEYDFSKGIRGKQSAQYVAGSNIIVLDPDVAKIFTDSNSVNETLRAVAKILKRTKKHISA